VEGRAGRVEEADGSVARARAGPARAAAPVTATDPGAPRASAPPPAPSEYVLGTNEVELARLTLQQEVWGRVTDAFLDRLAVPAGGVCLDVGCGPGLLLDTLSRRVGPRGRVDALDESTVWRAHLDARERARPHANVRLVLGRVGPEIVSDPPLVDGSYDLVLARWVLSFLPRPAEVVARLARLVKPGGVLAFQDYNHEGISLFPESEGFRAVVRATRATWASRGGDMWVAARLPGMLRAAGLTLVDCTPTVLAGGPSSGVFRWADSFFPVHSANMVRAGLLTEPERERFLAEWSDRLANPDATFFSPILLDVAGRKGR
jgi:SAM-dependent methyltransferase